jgi:hypothetical protein
MTARLRGGETEIVVDASARILSLKHVGSNTEFVRGQGSGWKLIGSLKEWKEHPAFDHDQEGAIEASDERIAVRFDRVRGLEAPYDVALTFLFEATPQGIACSWTLENRSDEAIREICFPLLSGLRADFASVPCWCGARFTDPHRTLPSNWLTGWAENPITYPGTASMSWMHLESGAAGLYLGSHDAALPSTALLIRRRLHLNDFQAGFARYPLTSPSASARSGIFLLAAHAGDWRHGARIYRAYADGWMGPQRKRRPWLSEAPAVCALFMKHQNGRVYFDYDRLAKIAADLKARDLLVPLFPFSWYRAGHDRGFPEYEPDPAMGGEEKLRAALKEIKRIGGRTLLYTQGRLMDVAYPWFRTGPGWESSFANEDGSPHFDRYSWPIQSTIDPGKHFAVGCPGAPAWREQLHAQSRQALALGADGLLFDQIGGDHPYLCFNTGHAHARPDLAGAAKVALLKSIRDEMEEKGGASDGRPSPARQDAASQGGGGLMLELTCDAFVQHTDLCHTKGTNFTDPGFPWPTFAEMYRYTFPEHALSSRDAQSPNEIRYAWLLGLIPEYWRMEEPFEHVDRKYDCDPDQTEVRAYREMMERGKREIETVIRVRNALSPVAAGRGYLATDGVGIAASGIRLARYVTESANACLAWNASADRAAGALDWDGEGAVFMRRIGKNGLEPAAPFTGRLDLAPGERAVLVREK